MSEHEVFLSYSHNDRETVEKIADALASAGYSCWIDSERLRAQERTHAAIDAAIGDARVFVSFLSKTYVNKPYCAHEFDLAFDKQKSILAICIDDVSESTNRQSAYMFSFNAGHNIMGFGTGLRGAGAFGDRADGADGADGALENVGGGRKGAGAFDAASVARAIIDSVPMSTLKRYTASGEERDLPPINTPAYILAQLRLYHEKQFGQSGNYALSKIRGDLFPAIKDLESNAVYKDGASRDVSLATYEFDDAIKDTNSYVTNIAQGAMRGQRPREARGIHFRDAAPLGLRAQPALATYEFDDAIKDTNSYVTNIAQGAMRGQRPREARGIHFRDAAPLGLRAQPALVQYITAAAEGERKRHIMVVGDGGMGKTVSLLLTCAHLLDRKINAVYIPLSKIDDEITLDSYIERVVCGGNRRIYEDLKALTSVPYSENPNVILLLDGVNEVARNYADKLVKRIIKDIYIDSCCGVQIIMTSRWFDDQLMNVLRNDVALLEMQTLDDQTIENYLSSMSLPAVTDEKLLSVIKTPLLLTLYADAETHRDKYIAVKGLKLEDNPDTAGKIIGNFFQSQLFRAAEEVNFDRDTHFILLEFLLPVIAFRMIEKDDMFLSEDDAWDCADEAGSGSQRFQWYCDDRLRRLDGGGGAAGGCGFRGGFGGGRGGGGFGGFGGFAEAALTLAVSGLHFLSKSDSGFEFLHPSFRDYFAAFHIANEIKAFKNKPARANEVSPALCERAYAEEILCLVSDIVREENARPRRGEEDGDWVFPGRNGASVVEPSLDLWRNKEGGEAQNAVANLFSIMAFGRGKSLATCDFSFLDMRKCNMNGRRFAEWSFDKSYPCKFDGAWIDRGNFLSDGHEDYVSAVLSGGARFVFSGDRSGTLKIYDLAARKWFDSISPQSGTVVDLAWNEPDGLLAILYANAVYCYSTVKKEIVSRAQNNSQNKSFRYVMFDDADSLRVAYDLEPLKWFDLAGNERSSDLSYDVPARCARRNPTKKEFIRSWLQQNLSVYRFDDEYRQWRTHPALRLAQTEYLSLRSADASDKVKRSIIKSSVSSIAYHEDGSRFLVTINVLLVEYDSQHLTVLRKRIFAANVSGACYRSDGSDDVIAAAGTNIYLLSKDFFDETVLKGTQMMRIGAVVPDYGSDGYYLVSSDSEIKKLNQRLIVQNIRHVGNKKRFIWVRDRLTGETRMAFLPSPKFPYCARYSYDLDAVEPLGWRYEFIDTQREDDVNSPRYYNMGTRLMAVSSSPPFELIEFNNYAGIWIFGCSFKGIKGDMSSAENQNFLISNGGKTDDSL